jgi:RND family efflux transporter MFP subunit
VPGQDNGVGNDFFLPGVTAMACSLLNARVSRGVLLVLAAAACAAPLGCGESAEKKKAKVPLVRVSHPVTHTVTDYEVFTGRTEPYKNVDVRSQVTGLLMEVNFQDGQDVKEGDLLFVIDPRLFKAEVDKAEAAVQQAEAAVQQKYTAYQVAQQLSTAKNVQTRIDLATAVADYEAAQATVKLNKAMRDTARINLSYTEVRAPFNGRVSKRMVDPGNVVKANDTVLTNIVTVDPIYATFYVDERTRLRVVRLIEEGKVPSARKEEVPVRMGLADEEGYNHYGTINFVDNQVDPQTGTLRARGIFRNVKIPPTVVASLVGVCGVPGGKAPLLYVGIAFPRKLGITPLLTPGLFVRVQTPIGPPHPAILVAEAALGTDQGRKFVYVVRDTTDSKTGEKKSVIEQQPVTVGALQPDGLRVIEKGVTEQDLVVVIGLQRIRPKMEVRPEVIDMPRQRADRTPFSSNATTQGK